MDAKVADGKRSFSEYVNIPMSVLDKAEDITNLNLSKQTEFTANLSCKYIGRSYFADKCTWLG